VAQIVASLTTIDLLNAELQLLAVAYIKTPQASLNFFLTAGDRSLDCSGISPLTVDGIADAKAKQAAPAFQSAGYVARPPWSTAD
jgi:hypothetical protein